MHLVMALASPTLSMLAPDAGIVQVCWTCSIHAYMHILPAAAQLIAVANAYLGNLSNRVMYSDTQQRLHRLCSPAFVS